MFLPEKKTFEWSYIFLISFTFNFITIVLTRIIIHSAYNFNAVIGFALLSFVISSLICLGYFGMKLFSSIFIVADLVAIINTFIVCLANSSDGWTDLTSFAMYLFILILGLFVALLAQVIKWTFMYSKEEIVISEPIKEEVIENKVEIEKHVVKKKTAKKPSAKKKVTKKAIVKKKSNSKKKPTTKKAMKKKANTDK